MSRSRRPSRNRDRRDELDLELEKVARFDPGKKTDTVLLLLAVGVLTQAFWNAPGITRAYPGLSVALGGLIAILSVIPMAGRVVGSKLRTAHSVSLVLLLWLTFISFFSADRFLSQQTLATWTGAVGFFVLVSSATSSLLRWRLFVGSLCLSIAALCVRAFSSISEKGDMAATFSNHDTFSVVPLVAVFLALTQIGHRGVTIRNLARASVVFFALTVVRTSSRAAVVGMFLGLVVAVLLPQARRGVANARETSRRRGLLGAAFLIPVLGAMMGLFTPLLSRVQEVSSGADSQGVTMRLDVLVHGLAAVGAHPILGSGPGTFALAYQEYRPPSVLPEYIFVNVAHNDFIEILVEFGVIGFLLVGVVFVLAFLRAVRLLRSGMMTWEIRCMAGGLVSLLGFASLNFLVPVPCLLFLAATVLGLLQGLPAVSRLPAASTSRGPLAIRSTILVLWGVWALVFGAKASIVQSDLVAVENLTKALRWEEAVPLLTSAMRLQPGNAQLYLTRGLVNFQLAQFQKSKELTAKADADLSEAARLSPREPKVLNAQVNFYKVTEDWQKAEKAYIQYSKMRPYDQGRAVGLCRILLAEGKVDEAADTLYSQALDQPEARATLVKMLLELERLKPGHSVALFEGWSRQGGEADGSVALLKECLEAALNLPDRTVGQRLLELASAKMPDDAKILYLGYQASRASGDKVRMKVFLDKLFALESNRPKDAEFVDAVRVELARTQPDYFHRGVTFQNLCDRLKANPKSLAIRLAITEIHLHRNEVDVATELVTRGLELMPENPALLARMGSCVAKQGLPAIAKDYFEQALRGDPANKEARRGLGLKAKL